MTPRVFIGSSVEGKHIAYAIQQNLEHDAFCTVWTQGIFGLGQTTIDALLGMVTKNDFGVFVLSPEDVIKIRQKTFTAPRDNVVFELALFMGRYGKDRAYMVKPRGDEAKDFHIPTDLLGITPADYDPFHLAHNPVSALGTASNQIRDAIRANPTYNRRLTFNVSYRTGGTQFPLKLWLEIRNQTGSDVVIRSDYFFCNGSLRASKKAAGNPSTRRYEIKFPQGDNLVLLETILLNGGLVRTYFPVDETHSESELQTAIANAQSGEFHYTCYWLSQTPITRRYRECV